MTLILPRVLKFVFWLEWSVLENKTCVLEKESAPCCCWSALLTALNAHTIKEESAKIKLSLHIKKPEKEKQTELKRRKYTGVESFEVGNNNSDIE